MQQIRESRCRDTFQLGRALEQIETKGTITLSPQKDVQWERTLGDVARAEGLRRRKQLIQEELEHIKGVLRHKQICMRSGGTVKTLHPALAQTSRLELKDNDFTL